MKVYRIRNKHNGLFSTGGMYPKWVKIGKIYSKRGSISTHFRDIQTIVDHRRENPNPFYEWELHDLETYLSHSEVVTFELVEVIEPKED